ncbi:MAG: hypothetical protein D6812_17870 [Deltaproteobacteria bacterium]|nr:MAG: hypothetical protein D6812_17870 [Deltaproteobacteria bacterium]
MTIYVSPERFEEMEKKLKTYEKELRKIREEKAIAYHESGDTWHDNPSFNDLEQQESRKVRQILELRDQLREAQIIDTRERNTKEVAIGSIVKFSRTVIRPDGTQKYQEQTYEIAGYGETDLEKGRVSYTAPIVQPLLGLPEGEIETIETEEGEVDYEVLKLYPDWESARSDLASKGEVGGQIKEG